MRLKSLFDAWNAFFFKPQSPVPIALFRIFYGSMVMVTLLFLRPDWLTWFGPHAWLSLPTISQVEPGPRLSLFAIIPQSNSWINALFWFFLGSAAFLTIGFLTRLNSVLVFVGLASIQQRNLFILHGGDTFLRVTGFFLIYAPAGAVLSVDRVVRVWRGKEGQRIEPRSPWAQRMIQLELALVYFASFCWKVQGVTWLQGTALYYVYHLDSLKRFPVPCWLFRPMVLKLGSWATLGLEFSLGVLIWVREFRYPLLALGLIFHLWLEYSLNIPLFQWDVLIAYVLFIEPDDLACVWGRQHLAGYATKRAGETVLSP